MPKYLVTTSKDVIRYIYLMLQKPTPKKKLKKIGGEEKWQMNGMNHQEILMLKNLKK